MTGVADQAVSSIGSLGVTLIVARRVGPRDFGRFALALSIYILVIGLSRAFSTDPLVIRFSGRRAAQTSPAASMSLGASLILGAVCGAIVGGVVLSGIGGRENGIFAVLCCVLPALVVQDAVRFVAMALGKPVVALINDAAWTLLTYLGLLIAWQLHLRSAADSLAVYGLAALPGTAGAMRMCGVSVNCAAGLRWLRSSRELGARFGVQFLAESGSFQMALFAIGAIAGLRAVANLKVCVSAFGPVSVLFYGAQLVLLPEISKIKRVRGDIRRLCYQSTFGTCVGAVLWLVLALTFSREFGPALFGGSWHGTSRLIVPFGAYSVAMAAAVAPSTAIRAMGLASVSLRLSLVQAPLVLLGPTLGAAVGGGQGAVVGLAIVGGMSASAWWLLMLRATKSSSPALTVSSG